MTKKRVAVLISGSGSNLQALIDAARKADYPAKIAMVISNKEDAFGLTRAQNAGIETKVIDHRSYPSREVYDNALNGILRDYKIDLVCLAGFMRVLSPSFVAHWQGKMINIHPSLLPDYKGLHTHARVIAAGEKESGCTVHWVSAGVDEGDIILQARVPVLDDDTAETLAARVLKEEHKIYPQALRAIIQAAAPR